MLHIIRSVMLVEAETESDIRDDYHRGGERQIRGKEGCRPDPWKSLWDGLQFFLAIWKVLIQL